MWFSKLNILCLCLDTKLDLFSYMKTNWVFCSNTQYLSKNAMKRELPQESIGKYSRRSLKILATTQLYSLSDIVWIALSIVWLFPVILDEWIYEWNQSFDVGLYISVVMIHDMCKHVEKVLCMSQQCQIKHKSYHITGYENKRSTFYQLHK